MSNPAKKKGTGGETELLAQLEGLTGRRFRRTHAGCRWDLETSDDRDPSNIVRVLATRPDRGRWLVTMPLPDWSLADPVDRSVTIRVEVKRYRAFAHHRVWEEKFA